MFVHLNSLMSQMTTSTASMAMTVCTTWSGILSQVDTELLWLTVVVVVVVELLTLEVAALVLGESAEEVVFYHSW